MNSPVQHANQIATEVLKVTPPAAYGMVKLFGISPADWVTYLTLLYIIIQLMLVIPKWLRQYGPWFTRQYIATQLLIKSVMNRE